MVYRGKVINGVVVFEGPAPQEGSAVEVAVCVGEAAVPKRTSAGSPTSLQQVLLRFAGAIEDMPPDAAVNHDHYLYGTPKRRPDSTPDRP